jgi:hypothetical protein
MLHRKKDAPKQEMATSIYVKLPFKSFLTIFILLASLKYLHGFVMDGKTAFSHP